MKKYSITIITIFIIFLTSAAVFAQISIPGSSAVTENFDAIGATSTAGLPANWKMSSAGTGATSNWTTATNVTAVTQQASSGSPTAGGRYNWATTGGTDRSIGFMTSGSYASPNSIMAYYKNTSGSTISDLTVNFQFERYRINTSNASVTFFTSTDGANWTASTAGDISTTDLPTGTSAYTFSSPTTVARAVNLSGINIPNDGDFYLRWVVNTTGSNSQGIGLDEVSVTAAFAPAVPNLAINDVSQDEGNAGTTNYTFTVSLSSAAHGGVTFDIATADNTATVAGGDYTSNTLTGQTIPNGTQFYQFTVQVNGDTAVEPNETFFVNITNVTGATPTDGQGTGTLVNDDVAPATVEFDSASFFEDESQTAFVNVFRGGNLSGTTTVDYTTENMPRGTGNAATGGATCAAGVDFIHQSGTLTFAVEDEFKQIEIELCADSEIEPDETFNVYLSNVTGGVLGETATAEVVINDTANQFVNTNQIFIGTSGDANDSSIEVSGAPTSIGGLRVTLFDFEHLTADDVDILLVGPQGEKFLLMADAGGDNGLVEGATVTFDDNAGTVLPDSTQIFSGRYEPTTWEPGQADFTAPAPAGPYSEPGSAVGGAVTLASVFGGTNANGTWTLYIRDDNNAFRRLGADGVVAGGWGLQFLAPTAAGVSVSGQVRSGKTPIANATVMITGGSLTEPRYTKTNSFGNYRFENLAGGQAYVVTVFSNRYDFPQSSIVLNLQDSVGDADFEAEER